MRTTAVNVARPSRTRSWMLAGAASLLAAGAAGCDYPPFPRTTTDAAPADAPAADADAARPRSSPILLSEVAIAPSAGEMIEIVNTSNQPVDLSTYYLSDSGNYYRLPAGAVVDSTDFIAGFPPGAALAGHAVATIAVDTPTNFSATYQISPTFSLADGTMRLVAVNGAPSLTNTGEPIILFQWDGQSDLVRDVDIMIVGNPSGATGALPSKSGVAQDGPDGDTLPSSYAVDGNTLKPQPAAPAAGQSTQRIALEDGHEAQTGAGNGPSGHDETSEDTSVTWDGTTPHPFGAPTPGQVPAALLR